MPEHTHTHTPEQRGAIIDTVTVILGKHEIKDTEIITLTKGDELASAKAAQRLFKDPKTPDEAKKAVRGFNQLVERDPDEVIKRYEIAEKVELAGHTSVRILSRREEWNEELSSDQRRINNLSDGRNASISTVLDSANEKLRQQKVKYPSQERLSQKYADLFIAVRKKKWQEAQERANALTKEENERIDNHKNRRTKSLEAIDEQKQGATRAQKVLEDERGGERLHRNVIETLEDIRRNSSRLLDKMDDIDIRRAEEELVGYLTETNELIPRFPSH